jgi:hypothetical protein
MTAANRIALIYGISLVGAGAISFYRGRRGQEFLLDTALHGVVAGTAFNVVGWLVLDGVATPVLAVANGEDGFGKMSEKAIALLNNLDTDTIFKALKENGVKIDAVPANPSVIVQDAD